jgi:hypothetical protein
MTSKPYIQKSLKETEMSETTTEPRKGIMGMIGKRITKTVQFMNEKVEIRKLSVAEVLEIQELAKEVEKEDNSGITMLKTVISRAMPEAADMTEEDFRGFPMDELSKLSGEIMKFSGIGQQAADAGKSS